MYFVSAVSQKTQYFISISFKLILNDFKVFFYWCTLQYILIHQSFNISTKLKRVTIHLWKFASTVDRRQAWRKDGCGIIIWDGKKISCKFVLNRVTQFTVVRIIFHDFTYVGLRCGKVCYRTDWRNQLCKIFLLIAINQYHAEWRLLHLVQRHAEINNGITDCTSTKMQMHSSHKTTFSQWLNGGVSRCQKCTVSCLMLRDLGIMESRSKILPITASFFYHICSRPPYIRYLFWFLFWCGCGMTPF